MIMIDSCGTVHVLEKVEMQIGRQLLNTKTSSIMTYALTNSTQYMTFTLKNGLCINIWKTVNGAVNNQTFKTADPLEP